MRLRFRTLADLNTKVIGYLAHSSLAHVVCTGSACVIAGSEQAMKNYLREIDPGNRTSYTIRKTRFGEIIQDIRWGSAYAFDTESYARFYPLARAVALNVAEVDFEAARRRGDKLFTVGLIGLSRRATE